MADRYVLEADVSGFNEQVNETGSMINSLKNTIEKVFSSIKGAFSGARGSLSEIKEEAQTTETELQKINKQLDAISKKKIKVSVDLKEIQTAEKEFRNLEKAYQRETSKLANMQPGAEKGAQQDKVSNLWGKMREAERTYYDMGGDDRRRSLIKQMNTLKAQKQLLTANKKELLSGGQSPQKEDSVDTFSRLAQSTETTQQSMSSLGETINESMSVAHESTQQEVEAMRELASATEQVAEAQQSKEDIAKQKQTDSLKAQIAENEQHLKEARDGVARIDNTPGAKAESQHANGYNSYQALLEYITKTESETDRLKAKLAELNGEMKPLASNGVSAMFQQAKGSGTKDTQENLIAVQQEVRSIRLCYIEAKIALDEFLQANAGNKKALQSPRAEQLRDDVAEAKRDLEEAEKELASMQSRMSARPSNGASDTAKWNWQEETPLWERRRQVSYKDAPYTRVGEGRQQSPSAGFNWQDESSGAQEATQEVSGFANALSSIQRAVSTVQGALPSLTSSFKNFGGTLSSIGKHAMSAVSALGRMSFNALKKGAESALGTLKKLGSMGFNAISKGAEAVKNKMTGVFKKFTSTGKSGNQLLKSLTGIGRMLKTRIKRTFISTIFKDVQQGIQNLAKVDTEFNNSMTSIKQATAGLSGNVSVAFSNLINAVAPALTTIINLVSTAIEYINAFFALLQGKTIVKAAKSTDDYAKSLKGAGGGAKELNNQLYGFDELNKVQSQSGGGGGGGANGVQYEDVDALSVLPEKFRAMFEEIIDAIKAEKWEEVGRLIGEGLNNLFPVLDDWIAKFRAKGHEIAGEIGDVINGFLDGFNFGALGNSIAGLFNSLIDIIYTYVDKIDWQLLGQKIAEGLNGIFDNVEWDMLGDFAGTGLNAVFERMLGFVTTFHWDTLGTNISTFLKTAFDKINWATIEQAITGGINGLITLFDSIDIDHASIAKQLMTSLNNVITGINWTKLETSISTRVNSLIDGFHELVTSDTMTNLGAKLGELVNGLTSDINWSQLATDVFLGLLKLYSQFWGIVSNINFANIAKGLSDGLNSLFDPNKGGASFQTLIENIKNGANKVIQALNGLVNGDEELGIQKINWESLKETLVNGINTLITQTDWATLIDTIGTLCLDVAQAFLGLFDPETGVNFKSIATQLADGISNIFKDENGAVDTERFAQIGTAISDGLKNLLESAGDLLVGIDWDAVGTAIIEALVNIDWLGIAGSIIDFLFKGLFSAVQLTGGLIGRLLQKLFGVDDSELDEETQVMQDAGVRAVEQFKFGFESAVDDANASTEQKAVAGALAFANGYCYTLEKKNPEVAKAGEDLISSIESGSASSAEGVKALFAQYGLEIGDELANKLSGESAENITSAMYLLLYGAGEEAVNALDTSNLNQNLMNYMQQAGVNLEIIANNMGQMAGAEYIDSYAEGINNATANQNIIQQKLAESLWNMDSEGLKQKIIGDIENLWDNVDVVISDEEAIAVSTIASGVALVMSDSFDETMQQQAPEVYEKAQAFVDGVKDATSFDELKNAFSEAGLNVSDEFIRGMTNCDYQDFFYAMQLLGQGVNDNVIAGLDSANLQENIDQFMQETGMSMQQVAKLMTAQTAEEVKAIAGDAYEQVGTNLGLIMPEAMASALSEGKSDVKESAEEIAESAKVSEDKQTDVGETGTATGEALTDDTAEAIKEGETAVTEEAENVATKTEEAFETLPDDVKPYAEAMMSYIVTALSEGNPTVVEAIDAVAQAVVDRAKEILSTTEAQNIVNTFLGGMSDTFLNDTTVWIEAEDCAERACNVAESALASDNGSYIVEAFLGGMQSVFETNSSVGNSASDVAYDAMHSAERKLSEGNGFAIADNFIIGMYNGTWAHAQDLVNAVTKICQAVIDTAMGAFDEHSPSKVFEQIGAYTMQGMEEGMDGQKKSVLNTMADIADAIVDEADIDAQMNVDAVSSGFDHMADRLSEIADTFLSISDILVDMGGLQLPAVAEGRVVPYQARIAGGNEQNIEETNQVLLNGIEDALYSAIQRAGLKGNSDQPIKVYLDGKQISDSVLRYQRQNARAMGV